MSGTALPPGYVRSAAGAVEFVARDWAHEPLRQALGAHGSLYQWAEAQADREPLQGRGVAWATTLGVGATSGSTGTAVVVRHTRHGGLFAGLTGDLFPRPTRAPRELATAVRLANSGVPTPEVIAYAVHPVAGVLARSDVMTRRLPAGRDFPAAWRAAAPDARTPLLEAVAVLLRALSGAGAHHPDLNVKNVYVAGDGAAITAYVLDVDRVEFADAPRAAARNVARFARSARKWNERHALGVPDDALMRLATLAWEQV
ncbi:MAG: lipopolysaccharide kinase InaA family protein [Gemmatimonadota bacterium]|nr:lipopolysaccharide kinase InaA family protein [Gemmatimonadota bacterium]